MCLSALAHVWIHACVCVSVHVCYRISQVGCGGQMTTRRSWFSPSIMCVPRIKVKGSGIEQQAPGPAEWSHWPKLGSFDAKFTFLFPELFKISFLSSFVILQDHVCLLRPQSMSKRSMSVMKDSRLWTGEWESLFSKSQPRVLVISEGVTVTDIHCTWSIVVSTS